MDRIGLYILAWFPVIILAILNAAIREGIYQKRFDELLSHQLSSVTFILVLFIYFMLMLRSFPLENIDHAIYIGVIWLFMTVCFEFLFGHYVMGHTWDHLLQDYNLINGRIWGLVLVFIAAGPYLLQKIFFE